VGTPPAEVAQTAKTTAGTTASQRLEQERLLQYYSLRAQQQGSPFGTANARGSQSTGAVSTQRQAAMERVGWQEAVERTQRQQVNAIQHHHQTAPLRPLPAAEIHWEAIALHDYEPSGNMQGQIRIVEGHSLRILTKGTNGWTRGINTETGEEGWFPTAYVNMSAVDPRV
tara:strand:+ start:264 stop:773 length:510 start_codon:yes stop_codon:yes gene_type:complete